MAARAVKTAACSTIWQRGTAAAITAAAATPASAITAAAAVSGAAYAATTANYCCHHHCPTSLVLPSHRAYGRAITKLLGLQRDESLTPAQQRHVQRMMPQAYHGATSEASDSVLQRNTGTNQTFLSGAVEEALFRPETGGGGGFVHHFYREDAENGVNGAGRKGSGGRTGSGVCTVETKGAGPGLGQEYWPTPPPSPGSGGGADDGMLFGTVEAQRIIFDHQHPSAGCGPETKFLIARTSYLTGHGIGSQFHILAANLALAMSLGRVLVLEPDDGNVFTKEARYADKEAMSSPFCNGVTSLECFLQPVSSCTATHAHTRAPSDGPAEWYNFHKRATPGCWRLRFHRAGRSATSNSPFARPSAPFR